MEVQCEVARLRGTVARLNTVLAQAQIRWFNALYDQGTPRDLHLQAYQEWLETLVTARQDLVPYPKMSCEPYWGQEP